MECEKTELNRKLGQSLGSYYLSSTALSENPKSSSSGGKPKAGFCRRFCCCCCPNEKSECSSNLDMDDVFERYSTKSDRPAQKLPLIVISNALSTSNLSINDAASQASDAKTEKYDLEDSGTLSNCSTPQGGTPQGTLQSKSKSTPSSEWPDNNEEEVDCLVAMHQQRSTPALGVRSDSMASVYSGAGDGRYGTVAVRGEVEFGMQYNYKAGSLEILVKQCRDLAPVDAKRSRSDPYVKVYLLPDKSKSGKRKTKVKKHTLNPIFEETLKFNLTLQGLETRTLWLTVWHSDMFGRNDFLGEVMMSLENVVFDDPTPKWYPLQERTEPFEELISYKGDLIVGLKFVPPEMSGNGTGKKKNKQPKGALHVLVKEAKNLTAVKSSGNSDPFCKSYLLPEKGRGSKQKTNVARRTCNPAWNHTFIYEDVSLQELAERSLELTVWDHDRLASNEFLGGLRFNLGTGKHFGKNVDWMDANGKEMSLWQMMLERPNFWVEGSLSLRPTLDLRQNNSCASSIATSDS